MQSEQFGVNKVNRVRKTARGFYDKKSVYQLIDELKLGHVAFMDKENIISIPFTVWRVDEYLYLHTANKSRIQKYLQSGAKLCISFAKATEWVLTKSAFHHSLNHASVVVFCTGERVVDERDFDTAFREIINSIEPERWDKVRPPNPKERKATALMRLTIIDASLKRKSEGPTEEPEDRQLPVWHGTCPYR